MRRRSIPRKQKLRQIPEEPAVAKELRCRRDYLAQPKILWINSTPVYRNEACLMLNGGGLWSPWVQRPRLSAHAVSVFEMANFTERAYPTSVVGFNDSCHHKSEIIAALDRAIAYAVSHEPH